MIIKIPPHRKCFAAPCEYQCSKADVNILQGSVAKKRLRCGGISDDHFIENLLLNVSVKEFRKSVRI